MENRNNIPHFAIFCLMFPLNVSESNFRSRRIELTEYVRTVVTPTLARHPSKTDNQKNVTVNVALRVAEVLCPR